MKENKKDISYFHDVMIVKSDNNKKTKEHKAQHDFFFFSFFFLFFFEKRAKKKKKKCLIGNNEKICEIISYNFNSTGSEFSFDIFKNFLTGCWMGKHGFRIFKSISRFK